MKILLVALTGDNQIENAVGWMNFGATPDYFNACHDDWGFPEWGFSVPANWGGYQPAASGNAYSAIGTIGLYFPDSREFIGGTLSSPLAIGVKYYVSFMTSLSIASGIESSVATNNTGALFSTIPYSSSNPPPLTNNPQTYSSNIITDSVSWTRVFSSFIADSVYQYVIIGNFFDDLSTDTIIFSDTPGAFAYYYIDDVCVSTDSIFCANYDLYSSLSENNSELEISIYPNPVQDKLTIELNNFNEQVSIKITDAFGKEVFTKNNPDQTETIDLIELTSGLYIIQVYNSNFFFKSKFLKI